MTTKWAHLPNAKYIDRVIASLKAYPELWCEPSDAAWDEAWEAAYEAAYEAARAAARGAARDAAYGAARAAARGAAWDAVLALIAYDDCEHMLDSDVGELKILAALGVPAAILLLPACIVFAKEKELV